MSSHTAQSTPSRVNMELQRAIEAILGDRPIAYHASLARALNSVTAGVFLSQLLYWQPRSQHTDGWVWKTQEQIYEETALTRREQETARAVLRKAGIIEEKRAGVPAKLYFRVDMQRLVERLSDFQQGRAGAGEESAPAQYGGKRQTRMAGSGQQDRRKPPIYFRDYSREYSREYIFESNRRGHTGENDCRAAGQAEG